MKVLDNWKIYTKGKQGSKKVSSKQRKAIKEMRDNRKNGKRTMWSETVHAQS